jgi:hypothetical protein
MTPFQLSGWDAKVKELVSERCFTLERAVEVVTLEYLRSSGDCRPLLDAALRGHMHSAKTMSVVAGMLDRKYRCGDAADVRYEFRFDETRTPGRPKGGGGAGSLGSRLARSMQEHGARKLADGIDPGWHFWYALTKALAQGNSAWIWRQDNAQASFPLKAKVQKSTRGKSRDPELPIRARLLAQLVKERIDKGEPYKRAIAKVVAQIEETRRDERSRGPGSRDLITQRTVRDAYDRSVHRRR